MAAMAAGIDLHLFTSGTLESRGAEVPVPFYLIRHPQGQIVIDGGNPIALAHDPRAHLRELADYFTVHMTPQQHCVAQLASIGVAPESISHVVQTHLHMDHTGALGHFPGATVVVHARELAAAQAVEGAIGGGYVRADYDLPDLDWQTYDGDHDLFGDGSVRLLETPGHAAGHVSLLLTLDETGPVLLTADAADNTAQWEGRAHPRAFHSRDEANASLQRLRDVAGETGALIVHGHDPDNWATLRHAPARYA
jgi:N-acyl homoserine lactone hydrolase